MADNVIMKNAEGDDVVYPSVVGVELPTESGGTATFIHNAEILQADWNEHKTASKAFILNKPKLKKVAVSGYYTDLMRLPFGDLAAPLEESTLDFVYEEDMFELFGTNVTLSPIVEGEPYKVVWDGTEYICTAKRVKSINHVLAQHLCDDDDLYLGNPQYLLHMGASGDPVEDTGEPFAVWFRPWENLSDNGIFTVEDAATHTISITAVNELVKLPAKYLPDGVATEDFVKSEIAKIEIPEGGGGSGGSAARENIPVTDFSAAVRLVAENDPVVFNAHNGAMILCSTTANAATFTDRTDATRYLIPIPANADKITVETTDEKVTLMQFIGVKVVGGAYVKVFETERGAANSYQFEKGAAEYIAINLIYEDTGTVTVPWEYDATATTTVTFSAAVTGGVSSWNDLTDKPFYDESEVILEEQTFDGYFNNDGFYMAPMAVITLEPGKTYSVFWDGTEYKCTADTVVFTGAEVVGVGNLAIAGIGENTGEPFLIGIMPDGSGAAAYTVDTGESHTIGVSRGIVKTLDNKYLEFMETGEASREELLAPGEFTFSYGLLLEVDSGGIYGNASVVPTTEDVYNRWTALAQAGGEAVITWDSVEYKCTPAFIFDGVAAVGNSVIMGGPDTGEPFSLMCQPDLRQADGSEIYAWVLVSADPAPSDPDNAPTYMHAVDIAIVTPGTTQIKDTYIPGPPEFDLSKMGLPALPTDGTQVSVACDTTALREAANKGAVKITLTYSSVGIPLVVSSASFTCISTPVLEGCSLCVPIIEGDKPCFIMLQVTKESIMAQLVTLATPTT